jgi:hypothetical protein
MDQSIMSPDFSKKNAVTSLNIKKAQSLQRMLQEAGVMFHGKPPMDSPIPSAIY